MTDRSDHRPAKTVRPRAREWRIDPRHTLAAALVCWTGFAIVALLVLAHRTTAFDTAGLQYWRAGPDFAALRGPAWLLEAAHGLTALGGGLLRNLFAITAAVALVLLRLRREAVLLAVTVISGMIGLALMKALFGRPRPTIVPHLAEAGGNSFPSGHSFNAALVFIAVALAFAAMNPRRSVRWTIIGSALALTLLIALSRVWLGVHFPSDTIAGWLGGAGWAFLASAVLYRPAKALADQSPG
jgi:undecaprenyl-diphosphatase